MKTLLTILIIALTFNAYSIEDIASDVQDQAEKAAAIIKKGSHDKELNQEERALIISLSAKIHKMVMSDIENEAKQLEMDKDTYIDNSVSMDKFHNDSLKSVESLEEITDAQKYILLIKIGLRLRIQSSIRFIPEGHFNKKEEVKMAVSLISESLGIQLK